MGSTKSKEPKQSKETGTMKSATDIANKNKKPATTSRKKVDKDDDRFRVLTKVQTYQLIESMLNERFPLAAILFVIFVDVILAFASIAFQIVAIVLKTDLYYIACGYIIS